jgi:hypothetical protein
VLAVEVERAAVSAGARLASAAGEGNGDSPADAFMQIMIDGAAQYEHGRSAPGLARRSQRSAPAALDRDGVRLVAAEREQVAIARARELRAIGLSLRAVALRVAVEGHVSRMGRAFFPPQATRMLPTVRGPTSEPCRSCRAPSITDHRSPDLLLDVVLASVCFNGQSRR